MKVLSKKQIEAARLIAEGDLLMQEIAHRLKITPQTLTNWKKKKEFNDLIDEFLDAMIDEQLRELKRITNKATRTLEKLLDAKSEMVRLNAATDILDRVGLKPVEKQKVDSNQEVTITIDLPDDFND
jgi:transposase-like protein